MPLVEMALLPSETSNESSLYPVSSESSDDLFYWVRSGNNTSCPHRFEIDVLEEIGNFILKAHCIN